MDNLNSDDLLIKSQLLISKFRKQREFSLKKQDLSMNKIYYNDNITKCNEVMANHFPNKNSSFHLKEIDNKLFNTFEKEYFHSRNRKAHKIPHFQNELYQNDDTIINGNLSESDNSLWSNPAESNINKPFIEKHDRGIMTEFNEKVIPEDEEVFTPVTALPPTIRSSDRQYNSIKERNSMKPELSNNKKYSSICTCQETSEFSSYPKKEKVKVEVKENYDFMNQKISLESMDNLYNVNDDENSKMKIALQLFQHEKKLESEINNKNNILENLNLELEELKFKINNELETINDLKIQKDGIKCKRYEIFNGISNELQSELSVARNSFQPHSLSDRSNHSTLILNDQKESIPNIPSINENIDHNSLFNLDNETVRNIVDKIIYKEFANSEDTIFLNKNLEKHEVDLRNEEFFNNNSKDKEDCILSDVLSVKDLKITYQPESNHNITSNSKPITLPIQSKNCGFPPRNPKSKKVKSAHSVDNIAQYSTSSNVNNNLSRPSSRRKMRSPAISEELKRYLHYQSSSDDLSS